MNVADNTRELQYLLEKVYGERGFDFREYRETTLTRRLERRLRARGVQTYADYSRVLDKDPNEYERLFDDLTINVTSFFRDEVAFLALEKVVLPALTSKATKNIRIWSAGCATGQEPYSIAMLLLELLGEEIRLWDIAILGTDVDAKALELAGNGLFAPKDTEGIRTAWLDKYFVAEGDGFRIQPPLKQLVTFEVHDLVSDPPYYGQDLVVCRNVLIYFNPMLQTRVLKDFYKGLKEEGFLLLGKAEVLVGETKALFACVDSKSKLFRRVGGRRVT